MPGIVVGVDGSGHSRKALERAASEAAVHHAPLTVLTVHQAVRDVYGSASHYGDDAALTDKAKQPHNDFIRAYVETGIVGFVAYVAVLVSLVDWVRNYVGFEFEWELQLVLARDETPGIRLGQEGRLGWTTWLGARRAETDADDLVMLPERRRAPGSAALAA